MHNVTRFLNVTGYLSGKNEGRDVIVVSGCEFADLDSSLWNLKGTTSFIALTDIKLAI